MGKLKLVYYVKYNSITIYSIKYLTTIVVVVSIVDLHFQLLLLDFNPQ